MVNRVDLFRDGDVGFNVSLDERCPNSLWADYGRGAGVGRGLGDGASLGIGVGVALDCAQYLPPVLVSVLLNRSTMPPHTIISLPVQTAV
jgi:hypothetical protein